MESDRIDNRADELPFAGIIAELLRENLAQHPGKRDLLSKMRGAVVIDLTDIETTVTLVFTDGRLRIDPGGPDSPSLAVRTASAQVMDLNALRIVGGIPWAFDEAGRTVVAHLMAGRLRIEGIFRHPLLLIRLTNLMSVV